MRAERLLHLPLRLAASGAMACAAACAAPQSEPSRPAEARELRSPAGSGTGEANLALSPDGKLFLTWIAPSGDGGHELLFATRAEGGPWSEPRRIARGVNWFVNWADFPSVLALPDGTLFAHWLVRSDPKSSYAYDVHLAASRDGGITWGEDFVPHRDGTATEHGFVSMFAWSDRAGLVWLDGRKMSPAAGAGHESGGMSLMYTTAGPGGALAEEVVVDDRVCECCQTSAAVADGAVVVAYRDRSPSEVRDVAVARMVDGDWSEPRVLGSDGWEIHGCPVNGPSVKADGRRVAVAWFAAPDDGPRVQVALSADAGASFSSPVRVDDGRPIGRVDVELIPAGEALVSWLEQVEGGAELRVRRLSPDGTRSAARTVAGATAARSGGFPRMERQGAELVFAWRDGADPPRVRTAVVRLDR